MICVLPFLLLAIGGASQSNDGGVRAALERRYDELARATERRDLAAFLAVRHETFHSVLPDGRMAGPMDMAQYSTQFFAGILPPVTVRFTIRALSVSVDGTIAAAEVFQEMSRFREIEGRRQKLETTVVQRETWIRTKDGWKLKLVDNVRDQTRRIDGKD
jgi:hypothetical protein